LTHSLRNHDLQEVVAGLQQLSEVNIVDSNCIEPTYFRKSRFE